MTNGTSTRSQSPLTVGDLIASACDYAAIITSDLHLISDLAANTAARRLARAKRLDVVCYLRDPMLARHAS